VGKHIGQKPVVNCYLSTLVENTQEIQALQDKLPVKRVWNFTKDPEKIDDMRKKLDDALALFQVRVVPPLANP
jgi:hypothetical protein